jgi:hypothetical protein
MRHFWALLPALLVVLTACRFEERTFPEDDPSTDPSSLNPAMNPKGAELGSLCSAPEECKTGLCVDGVCCESACDGVCSQCSAEGKCDVVPADDAACPELTCDAADQCTTYPAALTENRCEALGQCRTSCTGTPIDAGQLCTDAVDFIGEARCDGQGNCGDGRLANGAACTVGGECVSDQCVDGVCCAEACDGVCEVCAAPDGACVALAPDSAEAVCGENGRTCFERGKCALPLGRECTSADQCGSGLCVAGIFAGVTVCCDAECGSGQACSSEGHCIDPAADLGNTCQSGEDCTLGQCVDGVCCEGACAGVCERCNAPGEEGRCTADSPTTACDTVNTARRCLFRGLCQLPLGQACTNNDDCGSGNCEPAVGGGDVCCAEGCQAGVEACTTAGACQIVPRVNGSACGANNQCVSGSCQQGRCCPADCGGACEVCSTRGVCEIPAAGAEGCNPVNCAAQNTTCRTFANIGNLCEGVGDCKELADCTAFTNANAGTPCTVTGGGAGQCDGSGSCVSLPPAQLVVDTVQLDLGTAVINTTGGSRQFTVTNIGGLPTGNLTASNNAEFPATSTCLGRALAAGASCTISVGFRPSQPGTRSASLTISGGGGVSTSVGVRGLGDCGPSNIAVTIDGRLQCRLVNGSPCNPNNGQACQDGFCRRWFLDRDGDSFGGSALEVAVCGQSEANRPPPVMVTGNRGNVITQFYVSQSGDCCDVVQENAAGVVTSPQNVNPSVTTQGAPSFCAGSPNVLRGDLNCDGQETIGGRRIQDAVFVTCDGPPSVPCESRGGFDHAIVCGEVNSSWRCELRSGVCTAIAPINGGPTTCL